MTGQDASPVVVLLCAGFGTRMYPLTRTTPKALLDVAGRPVLDYLVSQLLDCGNVRTICIAVNNRFHAQFQQWRAGWEPRLLACNAEIQLYNNGVDDHEARLGAVGDLAFVIEQATLDGRDMLVAAGDNIFLFDIRPVWQQFVRSRASLLLAIQEPDRERLRKMGVLQIDEQDLVTDFTEKPDKPASPWVCPAFYCLTEEAAGLIHPYLAASNPKDAIGSFIQYVIHRVKVRAYRADGRRLDIGSMADYYEAERLLANEDYRI